MDWHYKLVKKIGRENLSLVIFGKMLFLFSIGGILANFLKLYGYLILVLATFLVVNYVNISFTNWFNNKKVNYESHLGGFIGAGLLILYFGIESPQIPFKKYLLLIGVLMSLPAVKDIWFNG